MVGPPDAGFGLVRRRRDRHEQESKPQNTAVPKLGLADKRPLTLVDTTNKVATVAKAHPNYAAHPEIQTSLTKWVSTAALIGGYEDQLAGLRAQIREADVLPKVDVTLSRLIAFQ